MNDDTSKGYVNSIIDILDGLVNDTLADYIQHPESVDPNLQLQWKLLMLLVTESKHLLSTEEHERLVDEVEAVLSELENAMEELDQESENNTQKTIIQAGSDGVYRKVKKQEEQMPADSLWTEDELKQFTTKGA